MSSITKAKIYNLALSALLLAEEVDEVSTNTTNEVRILNTHWDIAFESSLQDLDLDSLATPITLELLAALTNQPWQYAYKYPSNCVFLRRIVSLQVTDNRSTHIAKRTGLYLGQKAIFTDEFEAVGDCIPKNVPFEALSPMAALTIAYSLAHLSAPLIVGKGSRKLRETIKADYLLAKGEAQETDSNENFNYQADDQESEFVAARLS